MLTYMQNIQESTDNSSSSSIGFFGGPNSCKKFFDCVVTFYYKTIMSSYCFSRDSSKRVTSAGTRPSAPALRTPPFPAFLSDGLFRSPLRPHFLPSSLRSSPTLSSRPRQSATGFPSGSSDPILTQNLNPRTGPKPQRPT